MSQIPAQVERTKLEPEIADGIQPERAVLDRMQAIRRMSAADDQDI